MLILFDTHIWLWWVTVDRWFIVFTRCMIERAVLFNAFVLFLISVWEIVKKVEKW